MPRIFPKTHKESKQLALAKDEQTHFFSMHFGAWSFRWRQQTTVAWVKIQMAQSYMVWANPLGCNTKVNRKEGFNI